MCYIQTYKIRIGDPVNTQFIINIFCAIEKKVQVIDFEFPVEVNNWNRFFFQLCRTSFSAFDSREFIISLSLWVIFIDTSATW